MIMNSLFKAILFHSFIVIRRFDDGRMRSQAVVGHLITPLWGPLLERNHRLFRQVIVIDIYMAMLLRPSKVVKCCRKLKWLGFYFVMPSS
jgi:hypothetical protein